MSMADFSTRPLASLEMTGEDASLEMTGEDASLEMTEEDASLVPDEVAEAAVNLSFRPTEGSGEIFPDIHEYTAATAIPIHTEKK